MTILIPTIIVGVVIAFVLIYLVGAFVVFDLRWVLYVGEWERADRVMVVLFAISTIFFCCWIAA